jgi:hypothetical protein
MGFVFRVAVTTQTDVPAPLESLGSQRIDGLGSIGIVNIAFFGIIPVEGVDVVLVDDVARFDGHDG